MLPHSMKHQIITLLLFLVQKQTGGNSVALGVNFRDAAQSKLLVGQKSETGGGWVVGGEGGAWVRGWSEATKDSTCITLSSSPPPPLLFSFFFLSSVSCGLLFV